MGRGSGEVDEMRLDGMRERRRRGIDREGREEGRGRA